MSLVRTQRAIKKLKSVLAPKALAVEDERRRAEHAETLGFLAVALVELLHRRARFLLPQVFPGKPVLVRHRDPDRRVGGVALLGPERAQQRVRKALRVEAALLRSDHHPAGRLVPARGLAVLRI